MKTTVFEYSSYKRFLNDLIDSYPNGGRGQRKALAETIGCQVAYVTHVLSGDNHFSMEQIEGCARHFSLAKTEVEFLFMLLQQNRAGTPELRKFFDVLIHERREKHSLLKERLNIKKTLSREDQATYYSSWQYAAVHMALTIPEYRTVEGLSERLNIAPPRLLEILEFLMSLNLACKEQHQYKTRDPFLHLEKNSPLISKHHSNLRVRALNSLDNQVETDLHYSLIFSVAEKDKPKIREKLTKALEDCANIIRPSKEEDLSVLCLDLFTL
ncbi:hypothetical protein D3C87_1080740 [compost metagenome]